MPLMNRITWSGTALHAGVVPGYPASHGCIRLPFSFAPKLFQITTVGDNVIVARDRPVPQLIDHPALFQPLPPPAAPVLVTQEPPQRQSINDILPLPYAQSHIQACWREPTFPAPQRTFRLRLGSRRQARVALRRSTSTTRSPSRTRMSTRSIRSPAVSCRKQEPDGKHERSCPR